MPQVLENELALKIGSTWYHFPVLGQLQPQRIGQFPPKLVTGDYSRDTEPLASNWILEDLGGGFGVEVMDPKVHMDRFWDATLWTLNRNQLMLPPRVKDVGRGTVATGKDITAGAQYKGTMYFAFEDDVRSLNSSDVLSANLRTLTTAATDAVVFNGKLFFAYGSGYDYFDGATWASSTDDADFFVVYDSLLWKIDKNGKNFASSTDGVTWTPKASITDIDEGEVTGLIVFFSPAEELVIYARTKRGLWVYDGTANGWRRTMMQHALHPYGGKGSDFHRDALYSSAGLSTYKFSGSTVTNVGLDRDYGLPKALRGYISRLVSTQNWLAGLVDASQASPLSGSQLLTDYYGGTFSFPQTIGFSAVMLWNDRGWHHLWRSGGTGTGATWMGVGDAYSDYRLYWGAEERLYYTKLSRDLHNPLQSPDLLEWGFAPSGFLDSAWFHGGWEELDKLGIRLRARTRQCSSTEKVRIYAGYDLDPSWTLLKEVTTNGRFDVKFGDGAGKDWEYLRYRIEMERGSDVTKTPVLVFAATKYLKLQDNLGGVVATLDLRERHRDLHPAEAIDLLEEAAKQKTLVQVQWRDWDADQPVYMRVNRMVGQEWAGRDRRGIYNLALSEV